MPTAPPRICPRCHKPVLGRCSACQRDRHRRTDAERGTSTERGYTAEWRVLRVTAFVRDRWTCVECGWRPEIVELYERLGIPDLPATDAVLDELRRRQRIAAWHLQGDHIIPIAERPDLRLSLGNIQTLCSPCHSRKTRMEDGGFGDLPRTATG